MDPRVREVVEAAMQNNQDLLKSLEEANDLKMGNLFEICFNKNSSNPDRFADCFLEKQKKMEDIMNPMQFKIMFFSKSANNCLVQQKKNVTDCIQEATKGLKEVIENAKKSVEKI